MNFTDEIRLFVVEEMKENGITLGELSRRTGIDKGNLSKYINGHRGISDRNLDKVMAVFAEDVGPVHIGYGY